MIPGVVFEISIDELITRADHERRPELKGPPTGLVLSMPGLPASHTRLKRRWLGQRDQAKPLGTSDLCRGSVFVKEGVERNALILDEGCGVALAAGTDRHNVGTRREKFAVSVADLTGPLATRQSAKVAQKQHHRRTLYPAVAQPMLASHRINQRPVSQRNNVDAH